MKCLVVGHLVQDIIVKGSGIEYRIGGGAYYSAMALSGFCRVEILTSVGEDFPGKWLEELEASGIRLHVISSRNSTSYRLRYLDRDNRELTLLSVAERITDIPHRGYDIIILNPVAGEITPETVALAKKRGDFVVADVQGFTRSPHPGRLKLTGVDGGIFNGLKVLHADVSEAQLVRNLNPDKIEVLLVSRGADVGQAYLRGRKYTYTPARVAVEESTGAGDVFLASFSLFYNDCSFIQALKRAAAFTALFLQRRIFDFPMDEVNEMAMEVDVKPAR
ncbi:carbohydrate kinase family protein [Thermococcus aciditolerans]|uniref:Carbohydrate kinase n=1 Tax=Thermococcus aciditolerans TaxID=2598455 RepID=A0A5C0SP56_9EURY|nr:carbohydrate kinase [Thermococcus aciditolerans]QEK15567.1 carbohydrate kinase [Thermococcus aciditolerans]